MVSKKLWSFLMAAAMGILAVVVSIGLLEVSPALALDRTGIESVRLAPPAQPPPPNDDDLQFIAFFTDDLSIITDLSGNVIGEGEHGGKIRCNKNTCNQQTNLTFRVVFTDPIVYEYKFTTRLALNPEEESAVVAGKGTISSRGQKERFSFTATFQNNRDGTVWVRYEASRPDASFIIPEAPGRFVFRSR
jgi:hypothetical protein